MNIESLTVVVVNRDGVPTRTVAQYGRVGGSPANGGTALLGTLRGAMRDARLEELRSKCLNARFVSWQQSRELTRALGDDDPSLVGLNPDLGPAIVGVLLDAAPGMALIDRHDFAANSLLCEWAYVVDLDAERFEVYAGFNTHPLDPSERFAGLDRRVRHGTIHRPVRLLHAFSFAEVSAMSATDFTAIIARRMRDRNRETRPTMAA